MSNETKTLKADSLEDAIAILKEEADRRKTQLEQPTPQHVSHEKLCVEFELFGFDAHFCLFPFHGGIEWS